MDATSAIGTWPPILGCRHCSHRGLMQNNAVGCCRGCGPHRYGSAGPLKVVSKGACDHSLLPSSRRDVTECSGVLQKLWSPPRQQGSCSDPPWRLHWWRQHSRPSTAPETCGGRCLSSPPSTLREQPPCCRLPLHCAASLAVCLVFRSSALCSARALVVTTQAAVLARPVMHLMKCLPGLSATILRHSFARREMRRLRRP